MKHDYSLASSWLKRRSELRVLPSPLSEDCEAVEFASWKMGYIPLGPKLYGITIHDVPLLIIPNLRQEYDFGEPVDVDQTKLVSTLGFLATTQTGFMPITAPDFRFPDPLNSVTSMCVAASSIYAKEDENAFRTWMQKEIDSVVSIAGNWEQVVQKAISMPLPRQEMLMVPLVYLNHMWRQGSPALPAAKGSSAMPQAFDVLLDSLSRTTGILPRGCIPIV